MIHGPAITEAIATAGFTHVVWIPDSHLGTWNEALDAAPGLTLIRPCREGEAVGIAAGLMLGGAKPLVMIQCTGFFEAGDAVRNVVHDLGLPLKLLIGVRSARAAKDGKSKDSCPTFIEPVVTAWKIPILRFDPFTGTENAVLVHLNTLGTLPSAAALLWAE
ncbi:MAG TPA: thiamine pyrophosphate-binding protein [Fimbriiglobus sp.]